MEIPKWVKTHLGDLVFDFFPHVKMWGYNIYYSLKNRFFHKSTISVVEMKVKTDYPETDFSP